MGKRTPIGAFVHSSWTNLNIRAANGLYKHHQTVDKNRCYDNVFIEFSREKYRDWCIDHKDEILSLERPSLDRKNNDCNYTIDNIQVIELRENILKDKKVLNHQNGFGVCSLCKKEKPSEEFGKDKRRLSGRGSICKKCDSSRRKNERKF